MIMDKLFDSLLGATVDFNRESKGSNYGVAFRKEKDGRYCATVASQCYVIDVIGVPEPKSDFFSFIDNVWTDYQFPIKLEELLNVLYTSSSEPVGRAIVKNSNINNYLGLIPQKKRESSRLVIRKAHPLREDEMVLEFRQDGDKRISVIDGIDKPFVAIDDAPIRVYKIGTGFYRCAVVGEDESAFYVAALERFGQLNLDLLYTPGIYDKNHLPDINPEEGYAFPVFEGNLDRFHDIHVDTNILFTVLKPFFVLPPETDISIQFYEDCLHPMHISARDGEVEVHVKVLPLDLNKDKQWR